MCIRDRPESESDSEMCLLRLSLSRSLMNWSFVRIVWMSSTTFKFWSAGLLRSGYCRGISCSR